MKRSGFTAASISVILEGHAAGLLQAVGAPAFGLCGFLTACLWGLQAG